MYIPKTLIYVLSVYVHANCVMHIYERWDIFLFCFGDEEDRKEKGEVIIDRYHDRAWNQDIEKPIKNVDKFNWHPINKNEIHSCAKKNWRPRQNISGKLIKNHASLSLWSHLSNSNALSMVLWESSLNGAHADELV